MKTILLSILFIVSACAPASRHDSAGAPDCPIEVRRRFSQLLSLTPNPSRALTEGIKADLESDYKCKLQLFW